MFRDRIAFQMDQLGLPIEACIADRGYGHGPDYEFLKDRGVQAYIPLRDGKIGAGRNGGVDLIYDRKNDRYRCPMGRYLYQ